MALSLVNVGSAPNDGTGDPLRTAFVKVNANLNEIYGIGTTLGAMPGLGWFNVKAFGALGNGTTDDTAAINAAGAAAVAAGGGIVFLPNTTVNVYLVSRQANAAAINIVGSNVSVVCAPGVIVRLATTATPAYLIFLGDVNTVASPGTAVQYSNLWVLGGKWDANGSTDTKIVIGGWLKNSGCIGAECLGVASSPTGSAGINFLGASSANRSSQILIQNNYIHDLTGSLSQDGIITSNINQVLISGNRTVSTGRSIFLFGPHSDAAIIDNSALTMADNGIRVSTVNGGLFSDNSGVTIAGNVVDGVAVDGIRINGIKMTISANVVRNCSQRGIKADLCQQTVVIGNVVVDGLSEGIVLAPALAVEYSGSYTQNQIIGNTVINNGGFGIRIQGGGFTGAQVATGNTIRDNYCQGNAGGGISCEDTDATCIQDNTCEANTNGLSGGNKIGINVQASLALSATTGILVQGNKCWDLRGAGNRQTIGCAVQSTIGGSTLSGIWVQDNDFSSTPVQNGISMPAPTGTITDVLFENNRLLTTVTPINDPNGIAIKRGNRFTSGATQGRAVLAGGTVTVNTTEVVVSENVHLTRVLTGGTVGHLSVGTIVAGTSFVINSSSGTDTSTVFWSIVH